MKVTANRDLTYRVQIDREENETWAVYIDREVEYDISSVIVDVRVDENGAFEVRWHPHVRTGWRIKKDGTPGRAMSASAIYWTPTPETRKQEQEFKEEALRAARAMHMAAH